MRGRRTLLIDLDPQANSSITYLDVRTLPSARCTTCSPNGTALERGHPAVARCRTRRGARRGSRLAKLEAQLVGRDGRALPPEGPARRRGRPLRLRRHRHAAGARPHHRQRAGRGHAPADPGAVELLRARGHRRPAGDGGEDPLAAEPGPEAAGRRDHAPRQAHDARRATCRRRSPTSSATASSRPRSRKSIRLEESPAHKESIFTFAPQSSGAYEYYRLCEEVIERV